MSAAEVPGLSMATIEGGKVAWLGSFGVKDTKTGGRVDAQTVFTRVVEPVVDGMVHAPPPRQ